MKNQKDIENDHALDALRYALIMEEFKKEFGAFAILGKAGKFYNGAFANEARISKAQDFLQNNI